MTDMSHDQSKELTINDMKRQEQRVRKGMLGCHSKLGGAQTKIGTHPHKQKKFQNMAVGFTLLPRSVTACGQTAVEMALNNTIRRLQLNLAIYWDPTNDLDHQPGYTNGTLSDQQCPLLHFAFDEVSLQSMK